MRLKNIYKIYKGEEHFEKNNSKYYYAISSK